jgi:DivIVA domain-containing protein
MFSPEELEGRSFVIVRRGYDPDEVGAFLRAVADDMRRRQAGETPRAEDGLGGAVADAVEIVQAARESAARIEAQAEERALERMRRVEEDAERRLDRARVEADARVAESRDQAAAILAEAADRRAVIEAEALAARNDAAREAAQLDVLIRRRRRLIDDAHGSLEQWMSALREILDEARGQGDEQVEQLEPVAAVPAQDSAADAPGESGTYPADPLSGELISTELISTEHVAHEEQNSAL